MAFESLPKIAPALFSSEQDLIEVYNKKSDTIGVINPSYIKSLPSGVSGAIQFSNGSAFASDATNLFWDDTNKRLGVGTNAPTQKLHVNGNIQGTNVIATANINFGNILYGTNFWSQADGSTYIGAQAVPTARLQVKGSGSTSATTSLLVQNSAGTAALTIKDDRSTNLNGTLNINTGITGGSNLVYVRSDFPNVELFTITENQNMYLGALSTSLRANGTWYSQGQYGTNFYANNWYPQGGERIGWNFGGNGLAATGGDSQISLLRINPAIGNFSTGSTNQGNSLLICPTINQVNTGTHVFRGVYYNPTLTSLTSSVHYAWQNTSGAMIVNSSTPNASAILQADSTTQGFLPPRMTNAQRAAIATPAVGLMVYCTDAVEGLYVYKSTGWTFVI